MDTNAMVMTERRQKAVDLHCRIVAQGQQLALALVEFCRLLKEMRDSEMYRQLGFDSFDEYTDQAAGLKARMAYYYISTYEKLGQDFIEENSSLGITKLRLLAEVAPLDREEFLTDNELAGMTVEEIRAAVREVGGLREQLSLLQEDGGAGGDERSAWLEGQLKAEQEARAKAEEDLARTVAEGLEKINGVSAGEMNAQVEEAMRAAMEGEKEKAVKAARKEAAQEAKEKAEKAAEKEIEAAKSAALDEGRAAAQREFDARLAHEQAEKEAAAARAAELEKQLNLASSAETTAFTLYFDQMQSAFLKCLEQAALLDEKGQAEESAKLVRALGHAMEALAQQLPTEA